MTTRNCIHLASTLATIVLFWGCGASKTGSESTAMIDPKGDGTLAQELNAMSPEDQIETLRKLDQERPGDATVAFHFGNAYYERGASFPVEDNDRAFAYYDSAVASYQRAVEIDSTYSKAYVNMGLTYEALQKRPDARGALRKAIEVNPNDVLAYCHLGQLEASVGNYGEAMKNYRQALALDPNSAQAHYNLGLAFADTKVFKEALVEWEKVVALDPNGELGHAAAENVRLLRQYVDAQP